MESIANLKAKHDAELAQLAAELALASKCPVYPKRVQLTSGGLASWITYETASLADALALLARLGPIVPAYQYKGSFTRFQPESLATDKSGERVGPAFAFSVYVSQGKGYGPDADLRAFVMAGDTLVHAHIKLHGFLGGGRYSATCREIGRGHRSRTQLVWSANAELSAQSDKVTKWGSGSDDSARYEYHFVADEASGGSKHATEMLSHISDKRRRDAFDSEPMAEHFLSTLLQDLQLSEGDEACMEERDARDCGTIWNCPESTLRYAMDACRTFRRSIEEHPLLRDAVARNEEQAGSDLYMVKAGHGVGFRDRDCWADNRADNQTIGDSLDAIVQEAGRMETYIGDDGRAYIVGAE